MPEKISYVFFVILFFHIIHHIRYGHDNEHDIDRTDHKILGSASTYSAHSKLEASLSCQCYVNSRKYHKYCIPAPSLLYPVLITGLGGGGTHYVAKVLGTIGARLPHEELGDHGSVSWFYAVNDALVRGQYPHHARIRQRSFESPRFENVLHLLRCPMQHISSFTSHTNASYDFVRTHMLEQIQEVSLHSPSFTTTKVTAETLLNWTEQDQATEEKESVWITRNHTDFFQRRKAVIMESGRGCPRGGKCWLHFAALSWLFWNSHIQRYSDSFYRIEADFNQLISKTQALIIDFKEGNSTLNTLKNIEMTSYQHRSSFRNPFKRRRKERISSVKHKLHGNYSISDISDLDLELANEIKILARFFGYEMQSQFSQTVSEKRPSLYDYLGSEREIFNCV